MSVTLEEAPTARKASPLGLRDMCDATASGVEHAVVRLASAAGAVIDLCAHHYGKYELALIQQGFSVTDDQRKSL